MHNNTAWFDRMIMLRTMLGLRELTTNELAPWAEHSRERRFAVGDLLHVEGKSIEKVYLFQYGQVEMSWGGIPFRTIEGPGGVGVLGGLARLPEGHQSKALTDIIALEFELRDFIDLFEENFRSFKRLMQGLAGQAVAARKMLGPTAGFSNEINPDPEDFPDERLNLVHRIWMLRRTFGDGTGRLDPLAEMAADCEEIRHAPGESIWKVGDPSDHYLAILKGAVLCSAPGTEQTFRFGPDDIVGAMDSTANIERWYDVVVERELVALKVPIQTMFDVFEDHMDVALGMVANLAGGIMLSYRTVSQSAISDAS